MPLAPDPDERSRRDAVIAAVLDSIRREERILLPPFDPERERGGDDGALVSVGAEPNRFSGTVGPWRYQFEGEEDLLHLIVTRGGEPLTVAEGQAIAGFLLEGVSPAVIWLKPGERSQHFYVGHDELVLHVRPSTAGND